MFTFPLQGAIVQSLINRFKEFRRPPRDRSKVGVIPSKPPSHVIQRKPPIESLMEMPAIPAGEDHTSFKRHNQILVAESKKAKPNMQVVGSLMERTYAFRRGDIISSPSDVVNNLAQYPFLQNVEQVSKWWLYNNYTHVHLFRLWVEMFFRTDVTTFLHSCISLSQSSYTSKWIAFWPPPELHISQ